MVMALRAVPSFFNFLLAWAADVSAENPCSIVFSCTSEPEPEPSCSSSKGLLPRPPVLSLVMLYFNVVVVDANLLNKGRRYGMQARDMATAGSSAENRVARSPVYVMSAKSR